MSHLDSRHSTPHGLCPSNCYPCSTKGAREDKDHLLWYCQAWMVAMDPFLLDVMLLAEALKLAALSDWPPCLRLCGVPPELAAAHNGLMWGPGWKKRCKELHRVCWHWVPGPGEEWEEGCCQSIELALAGQQWADDDSGLLERLVDKLMVLLVAASKWLQHTAQKVNAKKLLAFAATGSPRRKPETAEATLDGVHIPI